MPNYLAKLRRRLLLAAFTLALPAINLPVAAQPQKQGEGAPLILPARYDEHRFYVEPVTPEGVKLNFFTDTGGGLFIFSDVVERLKIPVERSEGDGGRPMTTVMLPKFKEGVGIPAPLGSRERLFIMPHGERQWMSQDWSGMLGQQWFAGRVWTFDYPNRRLLLHPTPDAHAAGAGKAEHAEHRVALGFKTKATGERALDFPRIPITVEGETLDLLFDTGATTRLTEAALASLKDGSAAVRATSFITTTVFEKWRKQHPQWRVVEQAEMGSNEAMIEVPKVTVGGYTVGPVWFTRRADKNFHEYMTQFMDKRIEGALGGNALRHFRVRVDYPRAVAVFEK